LKSKRDLHTSANLRYACIRTKRDLYADQYCSSGVFFFCCAWTGLRMGLLLSGTKRDLYADQSGLRFCRPKETYTSPGAKETPWNNTTPAYTCPPRPHRALRPRGTRASVFRGACARPLGAAQQWLARCKRQTYQNFSKLSITGITSWAYRADADGTERARSHLENSRRERGGCLLIDLSWDLADFKYSTQGLCTT